MVNGDASSTSSEAGEALCMCTKETALRQWGGAMGHGALDAQGLVGWAHHDGAKANEGHRRSPLLNQNPTDERQNLRKELLLSSVNRGTGLGVLVSVGPSACAGNAHLL